MKNLIQGITISVLGALFSASGIFAQVEVFEHDNFRGDSLQVTADVADLHALGFGDRISSLTVCGGETVTLYEHDHYGGRRVTFTVSNTDLQRSIVDLDTLDRLNFGDKVSSIRFGTDANAEPGNPAHPPAPVNSTTVTLFEHDRFHGDTLDLSSDVADLHAFGFGDKISSLVVPNGIAVTLYEHDHYDGRRITFTQPNEDLHHSRDSNGTVIDFGDAVSSIRFGNFGALGDPHADCSGVNLRLLFVPLNWQTSPQTAAQIRADVLAQANDQIDVLLGSGINLTDRALIDIDVTPDFDTFNCNPPAPRQRTTDIQDFVRNNFMEPALWDFVIGIRQNVCALGPANLAGENDVTTMWITDDCEEVLAHELGHSYGLEDEYCSNQAGAVHEYCNDGGMPAPGQVADANPLIASLPEDCPPDGANDSLSTPQRPCCDVACAVAWPSGDPNDPDTDSDGLPDDGGYHPCCLGNRVGPTGDERSIMSSACLPGPRLHDARSIERLNSFPQLQNAPIASRTQVAAFEARLGHDGTYRDVRVTTVTAGPSRTQPVNSNAEVTLLDDVGQVLAVAPIRVDFGYHPWESGVNVAILPPREEILLSARVPYATLPASPIVNRMLLTGTSSEFRTTITGGTAPIADAGPNLNVECTSVDGATVEIDGSASFDPDGDDLVYNWSSSQGTISSFHAIVAGTFPLGLSTVELQVSDGVFAPALDSMTVEVEDTTPPELSCPNSIIVECAESGGARATHPVIESFLAGARASDACESSVIISHDAPSFFSLGSTLVTFNSTDSHGNSSSCVANVEIVDTMPPVVTCSALQTELWPPNHKTSDVELSFTVVDICDPQPGSMVTVSSDEHPAGEAGSGGRTHCPDAFVGAEGTVELRAERSGAGDGRVYNIVVRGFDTSGNVGVCSVAVDVPHSMGSSGSAVDSGQAFDATTCEGEGAAITGNETGARTRPVNRTEGIRPSGRSRSNRGARGAK